MTYALHTLFAFLLCTAIIAAVVTVVLVAVWAPTTYMSRLRSRELNRRYRDCQRLWRVS